MNNPDGYMMPQVPEATSVPGSHSREWGSGSPTGRSGPRIIHKPKPIVLAEFNGVAERTGVVGFRVDVPDSRIRVKISLIGRPSANVSPQASPDFLFNKDISLWLYAAEETDSGASIPVTNLPVDGTASSQASPVKIPTAAGLGGFAREMVTAADYIEGQLTINSVAGQGAGYLMLQTRYQPEPGSQFSFEEWDEIRRACQVGKLGEVLVYG